MAKEIAMRELLEKLESESGSLKQMKQHFLKRTRKHIGLVQKYCKRLHDRADGFDGIIKRGESHDASKFENPEIDPYIYLTWNYKCKDDGKKFEMPDGMGERMHQATEHHVTNNRHHPEFYSDAKQDIINRKDRDKPPGRPIDATRMPDLDIGEMIADWAGMAEERGGNPREWARNNIGKRWIFSPRQEKLIYELIDKIWDKEKS